MRTLVKVAALFGSLVVSATPACAEPISVVDREPVFPDANSSPQIKRRRASEQPRPQVVQRLVADSIGAIPGFANGKVELFRYQLVDAASNATVFSRAFDGAGITLKLSW